VRTANDHFNHDGVVCDSVPRVVAEGTENTFKVMLVLKSNVLLNNGDTSRPFVFRKRCAGHSHLQSRLQNLGACNA
jgi:hypothetical protein